MRNKIKIAFTVLIIIVVFTWFKIAEKIKTLNNNLYSIEMAPFLNYSHYLEKNIDQRKKLIFWYFNRECSYCEFEFNELENNIDALKSTTIWFVSTDSQVLPESKYVSKSVIIIASSMVNIDV
jgi:thioredoxin-related protein